LLGSVLIQPLHYCAWTLLYFDLLSRAELETAADTPPVFSVDPGPLPSMD